ncbi:hypothetical protein BS78_10G114500 [Paspalum vaginatum]|nr:hypothetical protein BS78_10G114500 [Paspalum vaginatum]
MAPPPSLSISGLPFPMAELHQAAMAFLPAPPCTSSLLFPAPPPCFPMAPPSCASSPGDSSGSSSAALLAGLAPPSLHGQRPLLLPTCVLSPWLPLCHGAIPVSLPLPALPLCRSCRCPLPASPLHRWQQQWLPLPVPPPCMWSSNQGHHASTGAALDTLASLHAGVLLHTAARPSSPKDTLVKSRCRARRTFGVPYHEILVSWSNYLKPEVLIISNYRCSLSIQI